MTINTGIYVLYFNNNDGLYYIGKSTNIEQRYKEHLRELKSGSHINIDLLDSYSKYGAPILDIIEEVLDTKKQSEREIYWIKVFDSYRNGLNRTIGGDGLGYGEEAPGAYYEKSTYVKILRRLAETDDKLGKIAKDLQVVESVVRKISNGSKHGYLAGEYPELWNKVQSRVGTRVGHLKDKEVYISIMFDIAYTNKQLKQISLDYSVNISVVKNIAYGTQHTYLKEEYPEVWEDMLDRKGTRIKGKVYVEEYPDVVSPLGEVYSVKNATKFAEEHGLTKTSFHKLLKGNADSHKGWTLA